MGAAPVPRARPRSCRCRPSRRSPSSRTSSPSPRWRSPRFRGVNTTGVVGTLLERGLVKISGRKRVVGRPFLYSTHAGVPRSVRAEGLWRICQRSKTWPTRSASIRRPILQQADLASRPRRISRCADVRRRRGVTRGEGASGASRGPGPWFMRTLDLWTHFGYGPLTLGADGFAAAHAAKSLSGHG